jgi:hypothetical protein
MDESLELRNFELRDLQSEAFMFQVAMSNPYPSFFETRTLPGAMVG